MARRDARRCACGEPIVITGVGKDHGTRFVKDHDMCRRCWRSQKDREQAAAARPRVDRETAVREKRGRDEYFRRRAEG
jgi:hypothetical protein